MSQNTYKAGFEEKSKIMACLAQLTGVTADESDLASLISPPPRRSCSRDSLALVPFTPPKKCAALQDADVDEVSARVREFGALVKSFEVLQPFMISQKWTAEI